MQLCALAFLLPFIGSCHQGARLQGMGARSSVWPDFEAQRSLRKVCLSVCSLPTHELTGTRRPSAQVIVATSRPRRRLSIEPGPAHDGADRGSTATQASQMMIPSAGDPFTGAALPVRADVVGLDSAEATSQVSRHVFLQYCSSPLSIFSCTSAQERAKRQPRRQHPPSHKRFYQDSL